MRFPRPDGSPAWTADWFKWFATQLTLPNGRSLVLEGHLLLIVDEIFAERRVEVLILLPKGQGKTALMAALAVWHLLTVDNANAFIGAADKVQADEMFRFACHYVDSEPEIEEHLLVRRSTREIRSNRDQGFLKVLASDDSRTGGKRQGFNPTLALLDELHAHENDNLYVDMRSGLFKNAGLLVTITTAGWDQESVLGQLRKNFLGIREQGGTLSEGLVVNGEGNPEQHPDGRLTIARAKSGRTVMLEWAVRDDDDIDDMRVVKLAAPASWVTIESLEDAKEAPGITPWAFARYFGNRWTLGAVSWLPGGAWTKLYDPAVPEVDWRTWEGATTAADGTPTPGFVEFIRSLYPEGQRLTGAMDMARYRDTAALGLIGQREDGKKLVRRVIWRPGGQDDPIRYEWVKGAIRLVHGHYELAACGFDPKFMEQAAEELEGEGIAMESFPQSNERMCPAYADLRTEIIQGEFVHDGDPLLESQMTAGRAVDVGRQMFRVETQKAKSAPPIDACSAVAMANALEKFAEPEGTFAGWA